LKTPINIRSWFPILLIGLIMLVSGRTIIAQPSTIILDTDLKHFHINKNLEYQVASKPSDQLQSSGEGLQSQWNKVTSKSNNFIKNQNPVWARFNVINNSGSDKSWLMKIGNPLIDRIDVFQYNQVTNKWSPNQVSGNLMSLEKRPIANRNHLFPLILPPKQPVTVYIRLESNSIYDVPLELWPNTLFWQSEQHNLLMLALFFGAMTVMLFYNLSLYFSIKDKSYFYYSFYVLSIILYTLAATGLGSQYIWDKSEWIKPRSLSLFSTLCFLMATLFVRQFLSLKKYGGWVLQLNNFLVSYWLFAALSFAFWSNFIAVKLSEPIALLSGVAGMTTGIYLWIKGNPLAKIFTIAWSFLIIGTFLLSLSTFGIFESNTMIQYSQMFGFVLEAILLSFALAARINQEQEIRLKAQQNALDLDQEVAQEREDKLKVQEQLLELQRRTNEDLELKVLDRTNELERTMKNLAIANQELSKLSFADPLTKVSNRRYFDQVMEGEIKRASRTQQPLSVAIADIDHFKHINDTFGHLTGDECLRLVANALSQQMRRNGDLIARYGGEEFAMILPATSRENAMEVADRAREAVENISFIQRGQRININVSIGVAGWIPEKNETPELLISKADEALYQAKNSGRNRSVAAEC